MGLTEWPLPKFQNAANFPRKVVFFQLFSCEKYGITAFNPPPPLPSSSSPFPPPPPPTAVSTMVGSCREHFENRASQIAGDCNFKHSFKKIWGMLLQYSGKKYHDGCRNAAFAARWLKIHMILQLLQPFFSKSTTFTAFTAFAAKRPPCLRKRLLMC